MVVSLDRRHGFADIQEDSRITSPSGRHGRVSTPLVYVLCVASNDTYLSLLTEKNTFFQLPSYDTRLRQTH